MLNYQRVFVLKLEFHLEMTENHTINYMVKLLVA